MLEFKPDGRYYVLILDEEGTEIGQLEWHDLLREWVFIANGGWPATELRQIADMLDKLGYGPLEDKT